MKRVALIHDLAGFGKCSLTAAIPVISAMGIQTCPLPTAILSAQTGFDQYFYDDYTDRMNAFTDHWKHMEVSFDAIYSGFLGSADQIENVLYFLEKFRTADNLFLADPVMGDHGKKIKIFTPELLQTMRALTKKADVITPNLTEACLLADVEYEEIMQCQDKEQMLEQIFRLADRLREQAEAEQTVVITGILPEGREGSTIGNLICSKTERAYLEAPFTGKSFSGTGDLFTSVLTGALLQGKTVTAAVQQAMNFLQPAIEEASRAGIPSAHGVMFEKYLADLMR